MAIKPQHFFSTVLQHIGHLRLQNIMCLSATFEDKGYTSNIPALYVWHGHHSLVMLYIK